jgi:hemerythrin
MDEEKFPFVNSTKRLSETQFAEDVNAKVTRIKEIVEVAEKFLTAEEKFLNSYKTELSDAQREVHLRSIERLKTNIEEDKSFLTRYKTA